MENQEMTVTDPVYCISVSPDYEKDGLLFAGRRSGLYRSTDGGITWLPAYTSLKASGPLPTVAIAVVKMDPSLHVFACVEGRILRSRDGGGTWVVTRLDSPPPVVSGLHVSAEYGADGTLVAATVQDGIYRSTDRGVTWVGWNFGLYDPNINVLLASAEGILFAGTQSNVFRSANGGRSWQGLDFPIDSAPVICLAMDRKGILYAGCESAGLFAWSADGKKWRKLVDGNVEHILIKENTVLIARDGQLFLSSDQGNSWKEKKGLKVGDEITCLASLPGKKARNILVGLSNGEVRIL